MYINEELISLETAKLAKEKGFNEKTISFYHNGTIVDYNNCEFDTGGGKCSHNRHTGYTYLCAPTQSLLQKWLRDIHQINIIVNSGQKNYSEDKESDFTIDVFKGDHMDYIVNFLQECCKDETKRREYFKTYEEALEKALFTALKMIDNQ